jgi:1-acyl-sn-glycerol-3-phosphate acyltransferase
MNCPRSVAQMLFPVRVMILVWYFALTVALAAVTLVLSWPLPHRFRFAIARAWSRGMLYMGRVICGLDWVVEGQENLPPGPSVIYIKHSSVFEAYSHIGIFPRQTWVVKRELLWTPVVGWGVAALKCIAIDRSGGGRAVKQVIRLGKQRLAEGIWISIFPEGTRMAPGETRRYGISGAVLAREAGCLVVPVAHNARDFFPRNGLPERPGRIRYCIGPPIDPSAQEPRETNKIAQAWIESKMAKISEGYKGIGPA